MLILHVGSQKTGSSSIQHFLRENEEHLRSLGINFVSAVRDWIDHNMLAWELRGGNVARPRLKSVLAEVRGKKYLKHIVSAEALFHPKVPAVFAEHMSKKQISNTRIVVYLRRPDELAESLYKQKVKTGEIKPFPKKFLHESSWEWDYLPTLREFENVFGRDAITVRPYKRALLKDGDVVSDFLDIVGITLDEGFSRSKPEDNPTFSMALSELMGFCSRNSIASFIDLNEEIAKLAWDLLRRSGDVYTAKQRLDIMNPLKDSLGEIVATYGESLADVFNYSDLVDAGDSIFPLPNEQVRLYRQAGRAVTYALNSIKK